VGVLVGLGYTAHFIWSTSPFDQMGALAVAFNTVGAVVTGVLASGSIAASVRRFRAAVRDEALE
jgi:hypothetical protein